MSASALSIVEHWLAAVNAGESASALALSAPDVRLIGPRGTATGRDVLRTWLAQAGATFATRAIYARGATVVVAQRATWRDTPTDALVGEADVATRFVVADGLVAELERYDALADALRAAGLDAGDRVG